MRLNELLHLVAFPRKAHGKPPTSGYVTAAKMPDSRAFSNSSGQFHSIHTPVSAAASPTSPLLCFPSTPRLVPAVPPTSNRGSLRVRALTPCNFRRTPCSGLPAFLGKRPPTTTKRGDSSTCRQQANREPDREQPAERLSRMAEAWLRIASNLDINDVLQEVIDGARSLTGARYGAPGVLRRLRGHTRPGHLRHDCRGASANGRPAQGAGSAGIPE